MVTTGADARSGQASPRGRQPPHDLWKAIVVLLALSAIIAVLAWALLASRFFVVRSVTVTGLHRVSRSQVLAAARIGVGLPLIRIDTAAAGRRVEAIRQVQSAQVSRSWPDGIAIHVTERTPVLAIRDGGSYDLIDGSGVVIASVSRRPAGIPGLRPNGPVRGSPTVAAAAAVSRELPAWLRERLRSITAPAVDDVTLHLTGGVTVLWGGRGGAAVKERVLAALMRTHGSFYDVRSPLVAAAR